MQSISAGRSRWSTTAFAIAAVLFLGYGILPPRADETTLAGAEAWASTGWLVGHLAAGIGFILYTLGLLGIYLTVRATRAEPIALRATVIAWIGAGVTLLYYGAEVYGLRALGTRAVAEQNPALLGIGEDFRYDPTAATLFALGLGLLAVGAVLAAVAVWRAGTLPRAAAVVQAVGFTLLIPQFFTPQPVRIAHAVLLAVGLLWLAWSMSVARSREVES
ncbi:hypothetical protein [Nocardia sp. AG03]|uniref:hypothetical protein n=1 Tax=Nocardia sp. AG03 TaxID=3025312 RepID=UPI002418B6DC|nr:hypothetical protein [Nocardia sp. AG03]